ncbi:RAD55 family ATPase [Jiella pelagia]|uniref:AAA family ATPase n=1 Tax=Jiella pelagia TaxID=2986949 RepID=A0ABY7BZY0_9HYPH|nr:ATPase domain-containing protein [Jiella pelagia]WAP69421.1 AAA family ATPase [Jiella pelagia]
MTSETPDASEPSLTRFESGLPELDQILGGGLVAGGSYIIQGSPGTGKTILANQICFTRAAKGQTSLYMTLLSESFSQMFGFLQSLDFFDMTKVPEYIYYTSAYATLRSEGLEALLHLIVQEIRKRRPSIFVFDGIFAIGELAGADGSEKELRRFLNEPRRARRAKSHDDHPDHQFRPQPVLPRICRSGRMDRGSSTTRRPIVRAGISLSTSSAAARSCAGAISTGSPLRVSTSIRGSKACRVRRTSTRHRYGASAAEFRGWTE